MVESALCCKSLSHSIVDVLLRLIGTDMLATEEKLINEIEDMPHMSTSHGGGAGGSRLQAHQLTAKFEKIKQQNSMLSRLQFQFATFLAKRHKWRGAWTEN